MPETPIGPSVLPNDWDGDGVSDADEIAAGTDPWTASSRQARLIAMAAYEKSRGMDDGANSSVLNVAGYWAVGIFKGVSKVAIPILMVSVMAGMVMKVIQVSSTIGGK